jgi:hypothetical protein
MKLPQLSLRDLFWLVLVCAMAVGWWVEKDRLSRRIAELEKASPQAERASLIQRLKQRQPSANAKPVQIRPVSGEIEIIPAHP